jgi:hypothetical protein
MRFFRPLADLGYPAAGVAALCARGLFLAATMQIRKSRNPANFAGFLLIVWVLGGGGTSKEYVSQELSP